MQSKILAHLVSICIMRVICAKQSSMISRVILLCFMKIVMAVFHRLTLNVGRTKIGKKYDEICRLFPAMTRITCCHLRQSPVKTESLVPVYEPCINSRGAYVRCVCTAHSRLDDSKLVARPPCVNTWVHTSARACQWVRVSSKIAMEREEDDRLIHASDDDA